jgi:hypothetical protein
MPKHSASGDAHWLALIVAPPRDRPGVQTIATCDHADITRWAAQHNAHPATGEATVSGPAGRDVNDMGVGIRFNFPGFAPFRQIPWDEWFENFDRNNLLFVFQEEDTVHIAERAYTNWQARGRGDGFDRDDWFQAKRDLQAGAAAGAPDVQYWIVTNEGH